MQLLQAGHLAQPLRARHALVDVLDRDDRVARAVPRLHDSPVSALAQFLQHLVGLAKLGRILLRR